MKAYLHSSEATLKDSNFLYCRIANLNLSSHFPSKQNNFVHFIWGEKKHEFAWTYIESEIVMLLLIASDFLYIGMSALLLYKNEMQQLGKFSDSCRRWLL